MKDIVIYPKKGKMIFFSVLLLLLSMLAGLFVIGVTVGNDGPVAITIGVAFLLLFFLTFIYSVKKVFKSKPALTLKKEGLVDRSNIRLIRWEEIEHIELVHLSGQLFLAIFMLDENSVIRQSKGIKRLVNKMNSGLIESQVNIAVRNLQYPIDQLMSEVDKRLLEHIESRIEIVPFEE